MFKGLHSDRSGILLCGRWYLAYNLSMRNLEEMMAARGIFVDHAIAHCATVHYSLPEGPLAIMPSAKGSRPKARIPRCSGTRGVSRFPVRPDPALTSVRPQPPDRRPSRR